jgi:hypothetical protein
MIRNSPRSVLLAVAASAATAALNGCGASNKTTPTYTQDPGFPPAAQLRAKLQPALIDGLPKTFACLVMRDPTERLEVYVTERDAVSDAQRIVNDLGGTKLAVVETASPSDQYRARQHLLKQLRSEAPSGVAVNEQTEAPRDACPKVGVDAGGDTAWLRRIEAAYPGRVVPESYTYDASPGTPVTTPAG